MSLANLPAPGKATAVDQASVLTSQDSGYNVEVNQMHLDAHNKYRAMHKVGPMTIDPDMAKAAQAYAEKLHEMGKMEHSKREDRSGCGENLAMHSNVDTISKTTHATDAWYSEVEKVDFNDLKFVSGTGHFTQVVWKGSTLLGMGVAGTYCVARYKAPGNMMGAFEANVFAK